MSEAWQFVHDFRVGDIVQRVLTEVGVTPYTGRVTAVFPAANTVEIQWPFGKERVKAEEVLRVNPEFVMILPPGTGRTAQLSVLPAHILTEVAAHFHQQAPDIRTYNNMWTRYAGTLPDEVLREGVRRFYALGREAHDDLMRTAIVKTAVYWARENRTHRATRREVASKCLNCPKCGTTMRRVTYKMADGVKAKLFGCPIDMFLIRQADVLGPDGQVVEW